MADFNQAVKWMKEGKKVRRKKYVKTYFRFDGELNEMVNQDNYNFCANLKDLEATDWEIYEDGANWNIIEYVRGQGLVFPVEKPLNKLKEKIIGDEMKAVNDLFEQLEENYPMISVSGFKTIFKDNLIKIKDKRFGF